MCAYLNASGYVDGCLTNDGDAFLYGAQTVYRNFTMNTKVFFLSLSAFVLQTTSFKGIIKELNEIMHLSAYHKAWHIAMAK